MTWKFKTKRVQVGRGRSPRQIKRNALQLEVPEVYVTSKFIEEINENEKETTDVVEPSDMDKVNNTRVLIS